MKKRVMICSFVCAVAVMTSPAFAQGICDDGNPCTVDWVGASPGQCTYTPVYCDDGNACTYDVCFRLTGCLAFPIDCDDGDAVTSDICDPEVGCLHASFDCDDGDCCTVDQIDPETGQCSYTQVSCDDADICTVDTCDATIGCEHAPVDCDDDNLCTADFCDPIHGCQHMPIDCDDGDMTTSDICDPADGICLHAPMVSVDVKPGSCQNPINVRSRGVLPVVLLGSESLDVMTIDPARVFMTREGFDGVAPLRYGYADVGTPPDDGALCACNDLDEEDIEEGDSGGDGYTDLVLKFRVPDVVDELGLKGLQSGETILLTVMGETLVDAIPVAGWDCVRIINKLKWWEAPYGPKGPK